MRPRPVWDERLGAWSYEWPDDEEQAPKAAEAGAAAFIAAGLLLVWWVHQPAAKPFDALLPEPLKTTARNLRAVVEEHR